MKATPEQLTAELGGLALDLKLDLRRAQLRRKSDNKGLLLIVEDDKAINDLLALRFRINGYHVLQAYDGETALDLFTQSTCDLVMLDLMLPGLDGWQVLGHIRETSAVPILMITGRNQERDELRGLSLGADDYVLKPFSFTRLLARVEALLRRSRYSSEQPIEVYEDAILKVDLRRRSVTVHGKPVHLSPTEYQLLLAFVRATNKVLSHEEILREVWGPNYDSVESVKSYVASLRRKIEIDPLSPQLIHTCWGIGYRYEPGAVQPETAVNGAKDTTPILAA
jgi:two-component system KDP operon response regulator KdpE